MSIWRISRQSRGLWASRIRQLRRGTTSSWSTICLWLARIASWADSRPSWASKWSIARSPPKRYHRHHRQASRLSKSRSRMRWNLAEPPCLRSQRMLEIHQQVLHWLWTMSSRPKLIDKWRLGSVSMSSIHKTSLIRTSNNKKPMITFVTTNSKLARQLTPKATPQALMTWLRKSRSTWWKRWWLLQRIRQSSNSKMLNPSRKQKPPFPLSSSRS